MNLLIVLSLLTVAVRNKSEKALESPSELYSRAMAHFQNRKFSKSAELFKQFVFRYPLSDTVDGAQFYLAKSYKEMKNYDDAITEYQFLISTFTTSKFIPEALLDIAECYISKAKNVGRDTEELSEALKYIRDFYFRYPDSPLKEKAKELETKIARLRGEKYLYIAKTYLDIGYPQSAELYLDLLEKEFPDDDSLLTQGKILRILSKIEEGKCGDAKSLYSELMESNPSLKSTTSKEIKKIDRTLKKKCKR
jgi:outer membrane assembly lipoprotein YfiO